MDGHLAAWLAVAAAALFAAGLVYAALRRWPGLGVLAAALVLGGALAPYRFDGEHWAPAFVVGTFRLLFEDDASPRGPLLLLAATAAGALALAAAALGLSALGSALGDRWHRFRSTPPRRSRRRMRNGAGGEGNTVK